MSQTNNCGALKQMRIISNAKVRELAKVGLGAVEQVEKLEREKRVHFANS